MIYYQRKNELSIWQIKKLKNISKILYMRKPMNNNKVVSQKSNLSEEYRGNGTQTPTIQKTVPMPKIKPAPSKPKK